MKNKKTIYSVIILLVVAGAITAGIIWYRNRKESDSESASGSDTSGTTTGSESGTTVSTGSASNLPAINSWAWWANKLGYAGFPLKLGSKGVEVVVVQQMLNMYLATKSNWALSEIAVDGIWGSETETRFKLFYPGVSEVSKTLFKSDFDLLNQLSV